MPKISIIVPVYNVETYLRECLDSLVNQTLHDIEIICVNDGSTDNSIMILEEYANSDSRIKLINKQNSGYGATMNIGINNANADYIGFLESDDIADVHMFEDLYNLITKNNCDFVKSDFYQYYTNPKKIEKRNIMKPYNTDIITNLNNDKRILMMQPSVWSAIYSKKFLNQNNIRFLETPGASYQDTSFHHKVFLLADRFLLTDKAYVYYRKDSINSSVNNKGKVYCIVDEYNEVNRLVATVPKLQQYQEYLHIAQSHGYFWNLNRLSIDLKEEFFNFFYKEFRKYMDNGKLQEPFFKFARNDFSFLLNSPHRFFKKYIKGQKKRLAKEFTTKQNKTLV